MEYGHGRGQGERCSAGERGGSELIAAILRRALIGHQRRSTFLERKEGGSIIKPIVSRRRHTRLGAKDDMAGEHFGGLLATVDEEGLSKKLQSNTLVVPSTQLGSLSSL